jgi:phospholipid/cholesterol/gamma-HCH transport system substrate-binding protein
MKKFSMETTVGIFVVIGLILIGYMTVKLGDVSILSDRTYPLYAKFSDVTGLKSGSPVDMFGIEIGKVEQLTMDPKSVQPMVKLKIRNNVQIYDDAIASIKTEGLLGDSYISVDPGGGGDLLGPGGIITDTHPPVDIIDLISKYAFGDISKKKNEKKPQE